jgi:hypothetical protein
MRAGGRAPTTSARPPDLEKGTASLVIMRIFIIQSYIIKMYKRS